MLVEIDSKEYYDFFPTSPNPFISKQFVELNKAKTDRVLFLVNDVIKPSIGLIVGLKNGTLKSPFSAPFGGFHYRKEILYISELDSFIADLREYIQLSEYQGIEITLPPDIYHSSFNAKSISALFRGGFKHRLPEITNWVDLDLFQGSFKQKNSKKYYRQALRNELRFELISDFSDKEAAYDLIYNSRAKYGRPIYMTLKDILNTSELWATDFFKVVTSENSILASAIFYHCHPNISFGLFWGDNDDGRPLRAMDFLAFNLWSRYKSLGYKYIDLGISTESGIPNEGLLRFKESHESTSSLKYTFYWEKE